MTVQYQHPTYGNLEYEESFWSGKCKVTVNGAELNKIAKKKFALPDGKQLTVKGSYAFGVSYIIDGVSTQITPKAKWWEIALAILPVILVLVWGNSATLCSIVPILGGAAGGAIGGASVAVSFLLMRMVSKWWIKVLIGIGTLVAAFFLCYAGAIMLLSAIA